MQGTIMVTDVYINLPVADVTRSRVFFGALGFEFEERFSNDDAVAVIIRDHCYAMLLSRTFFATFTGKTVSDAKESTEVLVAIGLDSREAVDEIVDLAIAAGGRDVREPQDYGFMYGRAFEDPDGHIWEPSCMDPAGPPPAA